MLNQMEDFITLIKIFSAVLQNHLFLMQGLKRGSKVLLVLGRVCMYV